jgi:alkylated DNA nucleotide flippase Atl1
MAMTPFARAVLDVVDRIPPGSVMSYGDIADYLGRGSPRGVGLVLARWGEEVPWHRVVKADGAPAPPLALEQLRLLREDGTPLVADGLRVDMRRARWAG